MGPKLEIATSTHSTSDLAPIVAEFSPSLLVDSRKLFGGYSCSNYRVDLEDGSTYCLKIADNYTAQQAELMCRTVHLLATKGGFNECCLPVSKQEMTKQKDEEKATHEKSFQFVSLKEKDGVPAFLLTFVSGVQADKIMREQPALATNVMNGIGRGLARMHTAAPISGKTHAEVLRVRWYETHGGCCDVQDHVTGTMLAKIQQCQSVQEHEFVPFYKQELTALQSEMKLAQNMPMGITHGDPFADNILGNPNSGDLEAFIDIEDVCAGPVLFDLACCAIGCCFDDEPPADGSLAQLNMVRLEALLKGYCFERKLTPLEREHFIPFMKLALLCNCCWRFVKFNVQMADDADIPEEARHSYLELQRRIEYLQDSKIAQDINAVIVKQSTTGTG